MGGPQGRSGQVRKMLHTPGFGPRTVQPVASRYADCAYPAIKFNWYRKKRVRSVKQKTDNDLAVAENTV